MLLQITLTFVGFPTLLANPKISFFTYKFFYGLICFMKFFPFLSKINI